MPEPNPLMDDLIYEVALGVIQGKSWALELDAQIQSFGFKRFYQLYLADEPLVEDIDLDTLGHLAEYFYQRLLRDATEAIAADLRDEPWASWALASVILSDTNDATNILLGSMELDEALIKFALYSFIQDRSSEDLRQLYSNSDLPQWYLINKNCSRWPDLVTTLAEKMVRDIGANSSELARIVNRDDALGNLVKTAIASKMELSTTSTRERTTAFLQSHTRVFVQERPSDKKAKQKRPIEESTKNAEEPTARRKNPKTK